MLALSFTGTILAIAIIATSLLLIGLVLLQKNRGSGLSGAFGGVGGHSAFGTKTGDVLTWITVGLAALFLVLNIAGNFAMREVDRSSPKPGTDIVETTPETADTPFGNAAPSGTAPNTTTPPRPTRGPVEPTGD